MMSKFCSAAVTVLCVVFSFHNCYADLIVTGPPGDFTTAGPTTNNTYGYTFRVGASDVSLTQLGYFDDFGDGLAASHEVGLWTAGGDLLRSSTVPSGAVSPLEEFYRMVDVNPITLSANETYVIGAQVFGDRYLQNSTVPINGISSLVSSIGNGIGGGLGRIGLGAGLNFPSGTSASNRYGLNANATITAIPEPSSLFLLASVGAIVGVRRFRGAKCNR
ncbi:DUF4082 domain-containing protein [Stieleria sp. JC731]|uniref:DUF4082 domain-containing protein n=1 Tax=Pirellulaceae TaxID=2691357 RepID=UPI001E3436C9|nr:DUF4082 domain-containing protein [Stieleria sp. JC731]MCC9602287.1 DUF4082 domain-containing protein [Stieleria sp. JC731]